MFGQSYFKDKNITVMRVGLIGRGIGDTAYLAECGAKVLVVDDAQQLVMQPAVDALSQYSNVTFKFGPYDFADFRSSDLVLVGAGAPMEESVLVECKKSDVRLVQSAALFAEISKVPIIGVTGTRGKSTVTHMIHHVLSFITGEKILLGGNIRGVSNLQLLKDVAEDSLCVMELDSWQLQGFGWAGISPQVAVFTNFMEDHLNYYMKGGKSKEEAMDLYFLDKAQIFLHQEESGVFITTPEVFSRAQKLKATLGQEIILADVSVLPEDMLLSMPGEHNRLNAALAYEALKAVGLTDDEIFSSLATFPGVEGRLQLIANIDGVKVYNDNNATTPAATTMAIKALAEKESDSKNIVLIAGGADKDIDTQVLVNEIVNHCKQVILIPGSGTDKLATKLEEAGFADVMVVENLKIAVEEARLIAVAPEVILFSPAFASFSQYKNEYERNDEFMSYLLLMNKTKIQLADINKIHFIGIGGIGMSALARFFLQEKKSVSGSDRSASQITEALEKGGVEFFPEQKAENIQVGIDLIVYTEAMSEEHEEMKAGRALGVPMVNYFEALGMVANDYYLIAVSGTHGKTTTTAMLTDVLEEALLDPTAIIGSLRSKTGSNYRAGMSKYAVVEACEYKRDFLYLKPDILVITNLEFEHVDYYKDLADVQEAFHTIAMSVPEDGYIVTDTSNPNIKPVLAGVRAKVIDYRSNLDLRLALKQPGLHNRLNAAAVTSVALALGIDREVSDQALENFAGTWRRFEYKGSFVNDNGKVQVYDDYGHHPTEITATILGARELYLKETLTLVFQPHTYTRTSELFTDFVSALGKADKVIMLPIYAAREENLSGVSSEKIVEALKQNGVDAVSFLTQGAVVDEIKNNTKENSVVLVMGAGDITKIADLLVN